MKRIAILCAALLGFSAQMVMADIPGTINFQGRLTDMAGNAVTNGTYGVTFTLHYTAEGNSPTGWSEVQNVSTERGYFSVALGSQTPSSLDFNYPYYLEIQVAGDAQPMHPRQPLSSVPYAIRAQNATMATNASYAAYSNYSYTLEGTSASGFVMRNQNQVTSADIQNGAVSNQAKAPWAPVVYFNGSQITNPKIACGFISTNASGDATIVFPITFTGTPHISLTVYNNAVNGMATIDTPQSGQCTIHTWFENSGGILEKLGPMGVEWVAIGQ